MIKRPKDHRIKIANIKELDSEVESIDTNQLTNMNRSTDNSGVQHVPYYDDEPVIKGIGE